jgi:hypothetical protein
MIDRSQCMYEMSLKMDLLNSRTYSYWNHCPPNTHKALSYLLALGGGGSLSLDALISAGVFSLDL